MFHKFNWLRSSRLLMQIRFRGRPPKGHAHSEQAMLCSQLCHRLKLGFKDMKNTMFQCAPGTGGRFKEILRSWCSAGDISIEMPEVGAGLDRSFGATVRTFHLREVVSC